MKHTFYRKYLKRLLDILLSLIGIILCAVPMLIIALAIHFDSPGPVFFKQKRMGKDGHIFTIVKFRTMSAQTDPNVPTDRFVSPERWLTRVGAVLRKTSLDEIPQLFNVLSGTMSIVGPRPALWNQLELIRMRDENGSGALKPGITGLAQINGRDSISEEEKARLDGQYAKNVTFSMDLRCFFGTFWPVLTHKGYSEGQNQHADNSQDKT